MSRGIQCGPAERLHSSKEIYVKFYRESESNNTVPPDNRLFNEALQFGVEIDQKEYLSGKPREI